MPREKKPHLKKRPDGRYACRYKGEWFYGATEAEALAARDAYKKAEADGYLAALHGPTVGQYAAKWLPLHKGGVSAKCFNDYAKQLEALMPIMGDKLLADVTVDDAAAVWRHFSSYSASTIKRARMLYIALFDTAAENGLCQRNPFRGRYAQPPKAPAGTHRTLTPQEIDLIRSTPHRFQTAAMLMLYAGLRRGEVLALELSDIDQAAGVIHITKAIRFSGNHPILVHPKTAAGIRDVPILSPLVPLLEQLAQRPAAAADGAVMTETAFTRAWNSYLHALTQAAGHTVNIRTHDFRHTYCTMLRDAGVDMHQAMLWLGHADEKMILRIYDHVGENRTRRSISQVETHLSSPCR